MTKKNFIVYLSMCLQVVGHDDECDSVGRPGQSGNPKKRRIQKKDRLKKKVDKLKKCSIINNVLAGCECEEVKLMKIMNCFQK